MPRFFFNSIVVAVAVTIGNLVFSPMLGYALAKLQFGGKGVLLGLVLATLMLPGAAILVPQFVLMSALGLVNTYPALILPFLAGPFGVFLTRQFFSGLPDELLEAARMDGASEFRIFWTIAMPLAGPVLATLGILTFLGTWNSFIYPLVMAQEPEMYTLPVALATFATGQYQADHGMLMAGAWSSSCPSSSSSWCSSAGSPKASRRPVSRADVDGGPSGRQPGGTDHAPAPTPSAPRRRFSAGHRGRCLSGSRGSRSSGLSAAQRATLLGYAEDTWASFVAMTDAETGLPADSLAADGTPEHPDVDDEHRRVHVEHGRRGTPRLHHARRGGGPPGDDPRLARDDGAA